MEVKQNTGIKCPVCKKDFLVDDIIDMGFINRAKSQPTLLEVCKRASKAHCLRGTILQYDLIKAITKTKKEGGL